MTTGGADPVLLCRVISVRNSERSALQQRGGVARLGAPPGARVDGRRTEDSWQHLPDS